MYFDAVYPEQGRGTQCKQKGFAPIFLLVGVLIVAVLGGVYYFSKTQISKPLSQNPVAVLPTLQPTPGKDETTNWKAYTNAQYQFSVKYPAEWEAKEFSRQLAIIGKSNDVAFRPYDSKLVNPDFGIITLEIESVNNDLSVNDYIDHLCEIGNPKDCKISQSATDLIVDGLPARKIVNPPAPVPSQLVVLKKNNKIYSFNLGLDKSYGDIYPENKKIEIFYQILSTFKFLPASPVGESKNNQNSISNNNQTAETSSWKTFSGFSGITLNYPADWQFNPEDLKNNNLTRVTIQDTSFGQDTCQGDCPYFGINFLLRAKPANTTLTEIIQKDYQDSWQGQQNRTQLKVDDRVTPLGISYRKVSGIFNGLYYIYMEHNNKIYQIFPYAGFMGTNEDIQDPQVQKSLATFEKVLGTIKFTD